MRFEVDIYGLVYLVNRKVEKGFAVNDGSIVDQNRWSSKLKVLESTPIYEPRKLTSRSISIATRARSSLFDTSHL